MSDIQCCAELPNGYNWYDFDESEKCTFDGGTIPLEDACTYSPVDDSSSNPFNWGGLNSFLSTLGSIAVPFLPFLFGTPQAPPPTGGAPNLSPEEYKAQNGMLILVGFVILIALSVGAYIYIKKRK